MYISVLKLYLEQSETGSLKHRFFQRNISTNLLLQPHSEVDLILLTYFNTLAMSRST